MMITPRAMRAIPISTPITAPAIAPALPPAGPGGPIVVGSGDVV